MYHVAIHMVPLLGLAVVALAMASVIRKSTKFRAAMFESRKHQMLAMEEFDRGNMEAGRLQIAASWDAIDRAKSFV